MDKRRPGVPNGVKRCRVILYPSPDSVAGLNILSGDRFIRSNIAVETFKSPRYCLSMRVKLRDARKRLTEIVKLAKTGVIVVLTDRGVPVADVVKHERGNVETPPVETIKPQVPEIHGMVTADKLVVERWCAECGEPAVVQRKGIWYCGLHGRVE